MVSPLRSSTKNTYGDSTIPIAQAQAWLQNALNALYYGADNAQATAMLRKVEEHLNMAASACGSLYIDSTRVSSLIRFGVRTGRGSRRQGRPNEDNFFATCGVLPPPIHLPFGLFAVADGMGGHINGQMASSMVIQQLADFVLPRLLTGERRIHALLVESIQNAHYAIAQRNQQQQAYASGMGSLVTTALIIGQTVTIANVGDSRAYLYRPGYGLQQITHDHSVVAEMVAAGMIGPDDVYTHPRRNEVYRALGGQGSPTVEIDLFTLKLEEEDKLLLCSDGVWEMVRDQQIESLMQTEGEDPASTAYALYEAAMKGGGLDNIGVVVVEYGPTARSGQMPYSLPLQQRPDSDPLINEEDGSGRPTTSYLPIIPKNSRR